MERPVARNIIRLPQVKRRIGMGETQIEAAMARGEFPKPVKIFESGRAIGWFEDEIDAYLEERAAARTATEA